jgi:hypothetical protein
MIDFVKVSESIAHELEVATLAAPILKELDRLRNAISGTALQIGEQLKKLHGIYSRERFSRFMRRDLPGDHGISRSTGYRWMVSAEKLSDLFPNRVVRDELMLRSDARGIFVDRGKDRKTAGSSRTRRRSSLKLGLGPHRPRQPGSSLSLCRNRRPLSLKRHPTLLHRMFLCPNPNLGLKPRCRRRKRKSEQRNGSAKHPVLKPGPDMQGIFEKSSQTDSSRSLLHSFRCCS